jgi:hypothetical protein
VARCAWLGELPRLARWMLPRPLDLRLITSPLLGPALPALTLDEPVTEQPPVETVRARTVKPDAPRRTLFSASSVDMPLPAPQHMAEPSGTRAPYELLRRAAGDVRLPHRAERRVDLPRPTPSHAAPLPALDGDWAGTAAERALMHLPPGTPSAALVGQMSRDVFGERASLKWLRALAAPGRVPARHPEPQPPPVEHFRTPDVLITRPARDLTPPELVEEQAAREQPTRTLPEIDPPLAMPSLLSLLTAQRPDEPTRPVAADAVRAGAAVENGLSGDDLGDLAAKLKRILDEEARRHGIDV